MTMERDSLVARLNASADRMDLTAKQILNAVASGSDYGCSEAAAVCRDAAAALSRPEQVVAETPSQKQQRLCDHSVSRAEGHKFCCSCGLPTTTAAPLQADASAPASPAIGIQAVKALADRVRALLLVDQPASWEERRKIADELESLSALHPAPEAASAGAVEPAGEVRKKAERIADQLWLDTFEKVKLVRLIMAEFPVAPSDTAPSPKGVSDGVRDVLEAELAELEAANEAATLRGAAVGARQERINHIRSALAALSQEPVPATAEERAASKEGA